MSANQASSQFLNGTNYNKILGFLRQRYTQKMGTNAIPERMDARLQKTVQHYMTEIYKSQGGKPINVPTLNQEVLKETIGSIDNWMRKQEPATQPTVTSVGTAIKPDDYNRLFEDTSTRYESMMASRAPPAVNLVVSDFRPTTKDPLDSEEDPVVLMQRMRKQREDQGRALGLVNPPKEEPVPSAVNPVPPQADVPPALLAPRQQDYIIPQEDIVKYSDTEYNIFLTSSDRDWLRNTNESRYNFSVNFNTGTKRTGYSYNAALQERFRNIQRIEFVKAILPIESLKTLPRISYTSTSTNVSYNYDLTRVINVLSLPFLGVRIAELNNNGFSTNPDEDNTFAIVQYDTTWSSDLIAPNTNAYVHGTPNSLPLTKSGYAGVIPKFLKIQKVYTPTPLATLQKLSIRMETHTTELLSDDSDVWFINRICMGGWGTIPPPVNTNPLSSICNNVVLPSLYTFNGKPSTFPTNAYLFVQTTRYFPFSAVSEGDTILFRGYSLTDTSAASTDFQSFINQDSGHLVIATGYTDPINLTYTDGRNSQGYCNVIVLQSRFDDPSTGSVGRTVSYFGGNQTNENVLAANLTNSTTVPNQSGAALINLSRQTHVVLRIISREMDSRSNIRPDNV